LICGACFGHFEVVCVATKLGRTPAQVLIRWCLEHETVVIPKSITVARIRENAQVFDFAIPEEDLRSLDALNEDLHTCWDPTGV